jgi:phosphatidylglycerol:prolipoprotein diacylglycerol transferase
MLAGILLSIGLWSRPARRDERLVVVYVGALAGAFLGAKLIYLGAEGWLHWHDAQRWRVLATGKSITGALLGGYAGVEIAKRLVGFRESTGDWFAVIAPCSIMIGRVGCILHGCCLGRVCTRAWFTLPDSAGNPRWPAAELELIFNAVALVGLMLLRGKKVLPGQLFHLYLVVYGAFRFGHEFLRATPQVLGPFSGYHVAAIGLVVLGVAGFVQRATANTEKPRRSVYSSEATLRPPGL